MFESIKEKFKSNNSSENNKKEMPARESLYKKGSGIIADKRRKNYEDLSRNLLDKMAKNEVETIHNVDPVFLVLIIILAAFAFIVSLSATNSYADTFYDDKFHFVWQNLKFYLVGIAAIVAAVWLAKDLRLYVGFTIVGFIVSIMLLVLVLIIGKEAGGAKRWISFGGFSIQPSEIAKTALVLALALYMSLFKDKINDKTNSKNSLTYGVLFPMIPILLMCGLVYFEKHNSGMIIIAVIGIAVMFLGGTKMRWIFMIGGLAIIAGVVLIFATGHGVDRIMSFFSPKDVITDDNWQTVQGLYAISSGGLFGLGPGESRLKYGYVSQPQNDFIFPIICEELGFVGGMAVVLLFLAVFIRAMKLGLNASNMFVSITICGLAVKLMLQVLLNICVVTDIIPNTGISLPLFSAGGSAMIFQLLEFGIILGLSRYCDVRS